ncbi:MAG: hypothetical protein ACD_79C00041G0001 [uncultured bacterium]|nr:MAG: hypothetical protein ACD_79C00041G0001 [uncultured bacterium]
MKYEAFGLSDVGLVRSNNEDSYLIDKDIHLFIVADGMGGYQKGEVASKIICDSMGEFLRDLASKEAFEYTQENIRQAIVKANSDIRQKILDSPGLERMGSTVISLSFNADKAIVMNVGDSRAYLFRKNKLEQISVDHSLVQETKAAGIKKELPNQFRNIVTRAVGMKDSVEPDFYPNKLKLHDKYLLCSDGLHGYVSDKRIREILSNGGNLESQAQTLIKCAKDEGGGKDNVTCLLIEITESPKPSTESTQTITLTIPSKTANKEIIIEKKNLHLLFILFLLIIVYVYIYF